MKYLPFVVLILLGCAPSIVTQPEPTCRMWIVSDSGTVPVDTVGTKACAPVVWKENK